ncbi:MAG: DUF2474 family protein [Novosphingobium sp.]|nr:DUF2474 family protein [Novosphingobium sp.]MCP5404196.1 DUF2474 family protein [Novosphingobium sp.]
MRGTLTKLGWFAAIWTASVAVLAAVSMALRFWLS